VHVVPLARGQPLPDALNALKPWLVVVELGEDPDAKVHAMVARILTYTAKSVVMLHGPTMMVRAAVETIRKDLGGAALQERELTTYSPAYSSTELYHADLLLLLSRHRIEERVWHPSPSLDVPWLPKAGGGSGAGCWGGVRGRDPGSHGRGCPVD
jgi:hypothetical protein